MSFISCLRAAEGYLELGLPLEANEELEQIEPELRDATEVMMFRLKIYESLQKWELAQTVAKVLAARHPETIEWIISHSENTRRCASIDAARSILIAGLKAHPYKPLLHFHIARYDCLLGDLKSAKVRLKHAFTLDPQLRLTALDDPDLSAIWNQL